MSARSVVGSYDVTSVWLVLWQLCIARRLRRRLIEVLQFSSVELISQCIQDLAVECSDLLTRFCPIIPLTMGEGDFWPHGSKIWGTITTLVDRMTHCKDMAILKVWKWLPTAILDLIQPEIAPFDLTTDHDLTTMCQIYGENTQFFVYFADHPLKQVSRAFVRGNY